MSRTAQVNAWLTLRNSGQVVDVPSISGIRTDPRIDLELDAEHIRRPLGWHCERMQVPVLIGDAWRDRTCLIVFVKGERDVFECAIERCANRITELTLRRDLSPGEPAIDRVFDIERVGGASRAADDTRGTRDGSWLDRSVGEIGRAGRPAISPQ